MSLKTQLQVNNEELQNHLADIMKLPDVSDLKKGAYVWKKLTAKGGDFVSYIPDNDPNKYPDGDFWYDGFYYELYGEQIDIVTWADGTDEQIVKMVAAADRGQINLADYWAVGQERKVTLSAMPATGVNESHVQQQVTFVLMNAGGKELASPVKSGRTECSFIVGMKNILSNGYTEENGYMNASLTNRGGWKNTARRTWCNNVFKNAIPSTLLPIFKEFNNDNVVDYFSLPSKEEVLGTKQFEYYNIASNRIKRTYNGAGDVNYYWTRTKSYTDGYFVEIIAAGNDTSDAQAMSYSSISPFGCI